MSGARAARYVLTAAEIAALARERRRVRLCAAYDALAARQARLADRGDRVAAAFGVVAPAVPMLGIVSRADVEALERHVADGASRLAAAEQALTVRGGELRGAQISRSLGLIADAITLPEPSAAGSVRAAPPVAHDRTRERDVAAAVDIVAVLDARITDTDDLDDLVRLVGTAAADRRALVLALLAAEVRDRNAAAAEDDRVAAELDALTARAALVGDRGVAAAAVAAAVDAQAEGRRVDLGRVEEIVTRAELVRSRNEELTRSRDLVVAAFRRRGYELMDGAAVYTPRGGMVLRNADDAAYAVGVDVSADTVVFSTVRLSDGRGRDVADGRAHERELTCRDIGEVCADVAGLVVQEPDLVGDDVTVVVPRGVIARRRKATPAVPELRADTPPAD